MGRLRTRFRRWSRRLRAVRVAVAARLLAVWHALRSPDRDVRVEILVADRTHRRRLEREIRSALRRLQRVGHPALRCNAAVLVQRAVQSNRPLAGCSLTGSLPDGSRYALIRLATHVNGRAVATDELLAAVAELLIGVAVQELGAPSVLVPVEMEPTTTHSRPLTGLSPDPLAARANGHGYPQADQSGLSEGPTPIPKSHGGSRCPNPTC